ncbi:MAG TPA: glycosyltransferase family 4 protein, partial [Chloroflexota bacterium]|nr:glycosyltransferase family 4 protein [Chloroflexota bacterium]
MTELRVLFVTPYYPPAHLGGIERAIARLALALRRENPEIQITVLTTHYTFPPRFVGGLPAREQRPEASVVRWASRLHSTLPLFPYYSCPVTWFGPAALRHILREVRPNIIHMVGDGWAWAHLALLALRPPAAAIVFTPSFHSMTPSRQWLRLPNRLLCANADATIVLTAQEQREIARGYHAPANRLHLIPW